jgi:hypothetical protein
LPCLLLSCGLSNLAYFPHTIFATPLSNARTIYDQLLMSIFYSNSFFVIPVFHFPWSVKGRERRAVTKTERETV